MDDNIPLKGNSAQSVFADAIDSRTIEQLRADYADADGSFLTGMIEAFVEDCRLLQLATAALKDNSFAELRKAAHRLKSSAATLGARQVETACSNLERATFVSDASGISQIMLTLPSSIVRARAVLVRIALNARSTTRS